MSSFCAVLFQAGWVKWSWFGTRHNDVQVIREDGNQVREQLAEVSGVAKTKNSIKRTHHGPNGPTIGGASGAIKLARRAI